MEWANTIVFVVEFIPAIYLKKNLIRIAFDEV